MTWICPKCDRELSAENATHYCARVSLDSLFDGKSNELTLAFDKLLSLVADWEDVAISTTPNCVVFVHRQTFLVIRPMKAALDVKFYSDAVPTEIKAYKTSMYSGRFVTQVRVAKAEDLSTGLIRYIRESYKLL